jgi:hypothetical protein
MSALSENSIMIPTKAKWSYYFACNAEVELVWQLTAAICYLQGPRFRPQKIINLVPICPFFCFGSQQRLEEEHQLDTVLTSLCQSVQSYDGNITAA